MDECYSFPGGKTLVAMLNDSKEKSGQAMLALASSKACVFDLEGGKLVSFPIDIPPKGMRLIVFEAAYNPPKNHLD